MAGFPTATISLSNIDSGGDNPTLARVQIYAGLLAVNQMIESYAQPGGIAPLDANGYVPQTHLNPAALLSALLPVDGSGTNLDADKLDGQHAAAFATINGSNPFQLVPGSDIVIGCNGQALNPNAVNNQLQLNASSLSTVGQGFGAGLSWVFANASGGGTTAGQINMQWTNASAGSESAAFAVRVRNAGTVVEQLRVTNNYVEMPERAAPAGIQPPTGSWWLYFTATGLHVRDDTGVSVGPLGTGGTGSTDHGLLTGNGDDDHTQYILVNGARAFSGPLQLGENYVEFDDRAADPAAPAAGFCRMYSKSGGVFVRSPGGIIGPIGAAGTTDHGLLNGSSLLDDDHPQYLLRQPTANVVINATQADRDFRIAAVGDANVFVIDAGNSIVSIGTAAVGSGKFNVLTSSGQKAINVTTSGGLGVDVTTTTGLGMRAATTTGTGLSITRSGVTSTTLVSISEDATTATTSTVVGINCASEGVPIIKATYTAGSVFDIFNLTSTSLTINDGSRDAFQVRVEGATATHLLFIQGASDQVNINSSSLTTGRLNVDGGSLDAVYAQTATAGKWAFVGVGTSTAGAARFQAASGTAVDAETTSGYAGYFHRNASGATQAVLFSEVLNAGDSSPVIHGKGGGTGPLLRLDDGSTTVFSVVDGGHVVWRELGADPTIPTANTWALYFKSTGLFYRAPGAGTITGPLGTGGGGGTALSGLTAAVGANTISSGANQQIWEWSLGSGSSSGLIMREAAGTSGSVKALLRLESFISGGSGSTDILRIVDYGASSSVRIINGGTGFNLFRFAGTQATWNDEQGSGFFFKIFGTGADPIFHAAASNNCVGVGTSSPAERLHVARSVDGTIGLAIENVNSGSNAKGAVLFYDGTVQAFVRWDHANNRLELGSETVNSQIRILSRQGGVTTTYTWPTADGTTGQVMTTNGSGGLSFTTVSASGGGWTDNGAWVGLSTAADQVDIGAGAQPPALVKVAIRQTVASNTSALCLRLEALNSAAAGGTGLTSVLQFAVEDSTSTMHDGATIRVNMADATAGAEDFRMTFRIVNNGSSSWDALVLSADQEAANGKVQFNITESVATPTGNIRHIAVWGTPFLVDAAVEHTTLSMSGVAYNLSGIISAWPTKLANIDAVWTITNDTTMSDTLIQNIDGSTIINDFTGFTTANGCLVNFMSAHKAMGATRSFNTGSSSPGLLNYHAALLNGSGSDIFTGGDALIWGYLMGGNRSSMFMGAHTTPSGFYTVGFAMSGVRGPTSDDNVKPIYIGSCDSSGNATNEGTIGRSYHAPKLTIGWAPTWGVGGAKAAVTTQATAQLDVYRSSAVTANFTLVNLQHLVTSTTANLSKTALNIVATGTFTGSNAVVRGLQIDVQNGAKNVSLEVLNGDAYYGSNVKTGFGLASANALETTVECQGAVTLRSVGTPTSPSDNLRVRMYFRNQKIIFQFNDGGTIRFKYLDLTSTGVTWVATTTAP